MAKPKPVSYYSKKADHALQELFRLNHSSCEVCGNPVSCAHHYYPKSSAGNLRYNSLNLIALCGSCHFKHHNGNPEIHNRVNELRGAEWLEELRKAKQVPNLECNTRRYYVEMEKSLREEINNFL